eukprot:scaffold133658_cov30-Tisochrysis_lutea.AAC.6
MTNLRQHLACLTIITPYAYLLILPPSGSAICISANFVHLMHGRSKRAQSVLLHLRSKRHVEKYST